MPRPRSFGVRSALVCCAAFAVAGLAQARPWWLRGAATAGQDFLPPDAAFRVAVHMDGKRLHIHWVIANGYYLYRSKMAVAAASPDLLVYPPSLPQGTLLTDRYFGPQRVYFHHVEATAGYSRSDFGAHPVQIKVTYQGCAQAGLCYPPIVKVLFPDELPAAASQAAPQPTPSTSWEFVAIAGGGGAFLWAGLARRKRRRLPMPPP